MKANSVTPARDKNPSPDRVEVGKGRTLVAASRKPLSTFSIDVDTASYSNIRRFLHAGTLPPRGAVRIEELLNYFSYDYPRSAEQQPFTVVTEVATAPWNREHQLVLIGLRGKEIPLEKVPPRNLVFLVDVSGSMSPDNKLPLIQGALRELVGELRAIDRVAIVVYADATGLVLPPHERSEE